MADTLTPAHFGTTFKAFMDAVVAAATPPSSPLLERIQAHVGTDIATLPVIAEQYATYDHPNVQVALDAYLASDDRHADVVGIGADNKRFMAFGLSDLVSRGSVTGLPPLAEGPVDYVNVHLAGERVLSCVQFGLYLIRDGDRRLVVFVAGTTEHGPHQQVRVEVLASEPEIGQAFLTELTGLMDRLNVYRGHTLSLASAQFRPGLQTLITFHTLPPITRADVILPEGLLERIERHTIVFAERAQQLRDAGRSLKRGMLLYGPPGSGKTLTIRYLIGRMAGRTAILTTGLGMQFLQPAVALARALAPSIVVLEDVDLIAEERMRPGAAGPLLFELLNEMDGLRDDSDIIFALTTNRPEILEPALAARPGRIDLAVELPLPDPDGRRRLLELYARGIAVQDVDWETVVAKTAGATPAYIKELLRKAAVLAAIDGGGIIVTAAHVDAALAELADGGRLAQRLLGLHPATPPVALAAGTGFPVSEVAAAQGRMQP